MKAGGAKGGAATSDAKKRSAEHYAEASRKGSIARAHNKGLKLYLVSDGAAEFRVEAADPVTAKARVLAKNRQFEGRKLTAKEIKA